MQAAVTLAAVSTKALLHITKRKRGDYTMNNVATVAKIAELEKRAEHIRYCIQVAKRYKIDAEVKRLTAILHEMEADLKRVRDWNIRYRKER